MENVIREVSARDRDDPLGAPQYATWWMGSIALASARLTFQGDWALRFWGAHQQMESVHFEPTLDACEQQLEYMLSRSRASG